MEMTIPFTDFKANDFSNRASAQGMFPSVQMSRILLGLLAGPGVASGALSSSSAIFPPHEESRIHAPAVNEVTDTIVPAGELINAIRAGWRLNMTELAEILGLSRPTLYNWLKGKPVADPEVLYRMQALAAATKSWKEHMAQGGQDFLLDYTGPRASEESIRQAMSRQGVAADEIRELIVTRKDQYAQAHAKTKTLLGEPLPLPISSPNKSSRRLHELWAENAKNLHRFQNSNE